jgi:hypothetical protein
MDQIEYFTCILCGCLKRYIAVYGRYAEHIELTAVNCQHNAQRIVDACIYIQNSFPHVKSPFKVIGRLELSFRLKE